MTGRKSKITYIVQIFWKRNINEFTPLYQMFISNLKFKSVRKYRKQINFYHWKIIWIQKLIFLCIVLSYTIFVFFEACVWINLCTIYFDIIFWLFREVKFIPLTLGHRDITPCNATQHHLMSCFYSTQLLLYVLSIL